jgi:hypothetical protein
VDCHQLGAVAPEAVLVGDRSIDRETHRLSLDGDLPDLPPGQLEDGPELGGRTRVDLYEDVSVAVPFRVRRTGDPQGGGVAGQGRAAGEVDGPLAKGRQRTFRGLVSFSSPALG